MDGVIQGSDGMLYGTTYAGGTDSWGTVFMINTNGTSYQVMHSFTGDDGKYPYGGVIEGSDGVLYGTTQDGGVHAYGTVFKINRNGTGYGVVHDFGGSSDDGQNPQASLLEAVDENLYGTTFYGGTNGDGTVFMLDKSGANYAVLHTFAGGAMDGHAAFAEFIQGADGALYSTTRNGGTNNVGTVFKLNPDGDGFDLVFTFTGTGGVGTTPYGGVVQDEDGNLYGTTQSGGGTAYKLTLPPVGAPVLSILPPARRRPGLLDTGHARLRVAGESRSRHDQLGGLRQWLNQSHGHSGDDPNQVLSLVQTLIPE